MTQRTTAHAEQEHHRRAFEVYFSLGAKRSYREVARQLGVSPSAVKLWSRSFAWQKRLGERDAAVARQTADQVIGSAVADASRKRKMVELALLKVIKAINSDQVRVQVGDLDRPLRLQAFLDGDRVPLTIEALKLHPVEEVAQLTWDWFFSLNDEDKAVALATMKRNSTPDTTPPNPRPSLPSPTPAKGQNSGAEGTERDSAKTGPSEGP